MRTHRAWRGKRQEKYLKSRQRPVLIDSFSQPTSNKMDYRCGETYQAASRKRPDIVYRKLAQHCPEDHVKQDGFLQYIGYPLIVEINKFPGKTKPSISVSVIIPPSSDSSHKLNSVLNAEAKYLVPFLKDFNLVPSQIFDSHDEKTLVQAFPNQYVYLLR